MTTLTDPARELADVCANLAPQSEERGDNYLAKHFGVPAWSREFYQILFCITDRADFLISVVADLDLDDDFKADAVSHIAGVKEAFSINGMSNAWKNFGAPRVGSQNAQPIKMLSALVRQKIAYPKLSDEELDELVAEVDTLAGWLTDHQIKEQDFIRQAILDGLSHFRFRLARLRWVGWGYTLESLRDVIGAYMALERGIQEASVDPVAKALLKKVGAFVKEFYEKTKFARDVTETGDFMLRAYGAVSLIAHGSHIAGLISSQS